MKLDPTAEQLNKLETAHLLGLPVEMLEALPHLLPDQDKEASDGSRL